MHAYNPARTWISTMISIIKDADRYHADHGWLSTRWHFSFSDYYDPENMQWGPLRVFNDDVVQPGRGFGAHPHRDMEIITYVLEGELEHQDHLGHRGIVHPGEVQVMSAGKGIMHSEANASREKPVHFMQLWVLPRTAGLPPRWEQRQFSVQQRQGRLLPVVSSGSVADTLTIDQDATIYVSRLAAGESVVHTAAEHRRAYLFVISGEITLNGTPLAHGDQAKIQDETRLQIAAKEGAEIILLDLP
jgi:redox-sensitive bicupin YhaK (pirin superfamily)